MTMSFPEARQSISAQPIDPTAAVPPANMLSKLAEGDSDSDKADALVRRTTGRLLSRLQQHDTEESSEEEQADSDEEAYERVKRRMLATKDAPASSGEEEDNGQGAYERMKQRLMASTSLQRRLVEDSTQSSQKPVAASGLSSSEEDNVPVRANRVRKLHTRRESTVSSIGSPAPNPRSRQSSLGLFVTPEPSPSKRSLKNVDLADDASAPTRDAGFQERVERIRAEQLAKRKNGKQQFTDDTQPEENEGSNSDGEASRRLTQLAKPTRKAGKKALEAMARDQQRIVRNMQLTHQAKTKKRYGTKDLFAKFGFNQGLEERETGLPTPDASSVPATSDVEAAQSHDTPPTSPHRFEAAQKDERMTGVEGDKPTSPVPVRLDKGKGRAPEFQHLPPSQTMQLVQPVVAQNAHVEPTKPSAEIMVDLDDSDDDLKVAKPKSRFPVFDKLPERQQREHPSMLHLRHLAQLTSPGKRGAKGKKTMNMVQLQGSLFQKARQQAQKERQEKVEILRAKGIIIETEEEKEKRQMEIEDLVAQFEKEKEKDLKLAKREREIAKKNGEVGDGLASSDEEEDEDYVGSGGENDVDDAIDAEEVELEASEDEEADDEEELDEDEDELEEEDEETTSNELIDTMAGEDEDEETLEIDMNDAGEEEMADAEFETPVRKAATNRVRKVVVDDEDDEEDNTILPNGSPTQVATQDDTMAAFGFGKAAPVLGLTQAFAGTMANLELDSQADRSPTQEPEQDSIDFLRSLPVSQPSFSQRDDFFVPNSQTVASQQAYTQGGSVPQMHLGISQLMEETSVLSQTQISEVPEPTQDAGFLLSRSPAGVGLPQSTAATVMLPVPESPIVQRKGKLHQRRREASLGLPAFDDEDGFSASDTEHGPHPTATEDAFSFLKRAAKKQKKIDTFNKKTSAAKEHLDDQAYESDDEYKGLGGASDEDSGEEDGDLAEMIDTSDIKVDERKIAALFA